MPQWFNSDAVNFKNNNSLISFKIPQQVCPFIVKYRIVQHLVEKLLQRLNLPLGFMWNYDPKGVISKKRQNVRLVKYPHHPQEMLDKISNLESWQEVKVIMCPKQEKESQVISTQIKLDVKLKRYQVEGILETKMTDENQGMHESKWPRTKSQLTMQVF